MFDTRLAMPPLTLGRVTDVNDPENMARVRVRLMAFADVEGQEGELWARVAMPVAGSGYGTLFVPDVDDDVIVGFLNGDGRCPIVLGGVHSANRAPATNPVDGGAIKTWSITGHQGTRVAIDETSAGPLVVLETPGGVSVTVSDNGTKVVLTNASSTITLDPQGVKIEASGKVEVQAASVSVSTGMVTVDAGMSSFSGVVKCDTLIATTVVASTYTPGAGNVW